MQNREKSKPCVFKNIVQHAYSFKSAMGVSNTHRVEEKINRQIIGKILLKRNPILALKASFIWRQ